MMKNILLILLLVTTAVASTQSYYYVISIEGEIYAGDQLLAPKDRLTNEMELRFVGAEPAAYLMSPSKGYFVLSAKEIYPPNGNSNISAKVVVCCPCLCCDEIAAVLRFKPGAMVLIKVDFPTPECPENMFTRSCMIFLSLLMLMLSQA